MGNKNTEIRQNRKGLKHRFKIRDNKELDDGPILVDLEERDELKGFNIEPSVLKKIALKDRRQ